MLSDLRVPSTNEHFFITQYPLEMSRPAIELGVMKNLSEMYELTRNVLEAEMALVIFPRAYQYSKKESPRNWEASVYREHRFLKEPFRYFELVADSLPYPVLDLLPDFEGAEEFPLFFQADPHWNRAGARVAARSTYRRLARQGLIPCAAD